MQSPSPRQQQSFENFSAKTDRVPCSVKDKDHVLVAMTLEQAQAALQALDLFSRIGLGQVSEIAHLVSTGFVPVSGDGAAPRKPAAVEIVEAVELLMQQVKKTLGYTSGGSLGVGHPHVAVEAARAYELQKVIAMAVATRPGSTVPMFAVDRDGLGPRYTQDPAPEAQWAQASR